MSSEITCMNDHGHGQQCGDCRWEQAMGWEEEGKEGKIVIE